ncbi:MAG: hypothetical protein HY292_00595 [Planctomycetes bacterium]|nr:hypothetical protein [Planctomycetota bacterium]
MKATTRRDDRDAAGIRLLRAPVSLATLGLGTAAAIGFALGIAILSALLGIDGLLEKVAITLGTWVMPLPVGPAPGWLTESGGRVGFLVVIAVFAWGAVLWSTFGVAIARAAGVRLAQDRSIGMREALSFAVAHSKSALAFPLLVTCAIGFLVLVNGLAGLVAEVPYLGPIALILSFPLTLLATLAAVMVGVGGVLGIGLATASYGIERNGPLDAVSRSYSYLCSRPHQVVLYVALAYLFGGFLWFAGDVLVVNGTLASLRSLAYGNVAKSVFPAALGDVPLSSVKVFPESLAALFVYLFVWLAKQAVLGLVIAYFVASACSAYLILRRDVDDIPENEIAVVEAPKPSLAPASPPPPAPAPPPS